MSPHVPYINTLTTRQVVYETSSNQIKLQPGGQGQYTYREPKTLLPTYPLP